MKPCYHSEAVTVGEHYVWCEKCGSVRRTNLKFEGWVEPQVAQAATDLMNHLNANVGHTDEWPIEIKTATTEDAETLAKLLTALQSAITTKDE